MAPEPSIVGVEPYRARFAEAAPHLPGARLPWLADLRARAIERFAAKGFPHHKVENWKYTSLRPLARVAFGDAKPEATGVQVPPAFLPRGAEAHRLVFVNGRFRPDLSAIGALPAGVLLTGLGDAIATYPDLVVERLGALADLDEHPLLALNTALMADGLFLHLGRDVALQAPIELTFIGGVGGGQPAYHPRHLVVAEAGSQATIVEHHVGGSGAYFANGGAEIFVEAKATLRHYKVQAEGREAWHIALTHARLGPGAVYDNFVLSAGGQLARNEVRARIDGPGAVCHLNGAYMGRERQHLDHTTLIDHASPHGTSRQTYHGVLDGHARAVFQGQVLVRPGAQKTDGYQLNRAVLLSDTAEIDSKPMLEIYADDVKCSHGATAGELDDDALFYLRTRGIPREDARGLLIDAFLGTVVAKADHEAFREAARQSIAAWLQG